MPAVLSPSVEAKVRRSIKEKLALCKKVQIRRSGKGKDQEKAQSEKDSHSKNRGGKKPN